MGVFDRPKAWAKEMDRIMGYTDTINKDNYLVDLANAVVYVREAAETIERLQAKVRELEGVAKTEFKQGFETGYGRALMSPEEMERIVNCHVPTSVIAKQGEE